MRRTLAVAVAVAVVMTVLASSTMAANNGKAEAFGKMIQAQCTAFYAQEAQSQSPLYGKKVTYGKLWQFVKKEQSHAGVKPSAQRFVRSGQLDQHCPVADLNTAGGKGTGNAWGKLIRVQCTAFYSLPAQGDSPYYEQKMAFGKLWRIVKKEQSHAGVKPSAKRFATNQLEDHCPVT